MPWLPWPVSCNGDSRLAQLGTAWHLQFLGNLQGIEPSLSTNQLLPVVALEAPAAQAPKISKVRLVKISHYWSPLLITIIDHIWSHLITFDHIWSPYQIWQDYGRYGWKWYEMMPKKTKKKHFANAQLLGLQLSFWSGTRTPHDAHPFSSQGREDLLGLGTMAHTWQTLSHVFILQVQRKHFARLVRKHTRNTWIVRRRKEMGSRCRSPYISSDYIQYSVIESYLPTKNAMRPAPRKHHHIILAHVQLPKTWSV